MVTLVKVTMKRGGCGAAIAAVAWLCCAVIAPRAHGFSATGGTVTNYLLNGTNFTAHIFATVGSNNLTVSVGGSVEVLLVGGGGGGGSTIAGGGGAGGILFTNLFTVVPGSHTVIVGAGGAGGTSGGNRGTTGSNSMFGALVAYGGGGGGGWNNAVGLSGGSGGGGANSQTGGVSSAAGQGNAGGSGTGNGGGGGGAAATAGTNAMSDLGGQGGAGLAFDLSGAPTNYAGGGGGGARNGSATPGMGGLGGGGNGAVTGVGEAGQANTGGGGGGGGYDGAYYAGGPGGSGIVIIRYGPEPGAPFVHNGSASNILDTSAWLNGSLFSPGTAGTPAQVWVYWDTNNWTTNKTWPNNHDFGETPAATNLTWQATGLTQQTWYYYTFHASNTLGEHWAQTSTTFQTWGPLQVDNAGGATNIGIKRAILQGTLLDGVGAFATIYWWTNAAPTSNSASIGWVNVGQSFAASATGLRDDTLYYYRCFVSNSFTTGWSDVTNFSTPYFDGSYYVATNGPASGIGNSWAQAFTNLQTAIDAANPGDTIRIAAHTFANSTPQSGSQYVWTNKPLTILGGYAADGGSPGALTNAPTILTRTGGTARILYINGLTNGLLQRVTLADGYCPQDATMSGLGLYVTACSNLMIASCVVSNNAGATVAGTLYGGGVYFAGSIARLTNCVVVLNGISGYQDNGNVRGGGIYMASGALTLEECRVEKNSSFIGQCWGGGVYLASGTLTISNSVVRHNATYFHSMAPTYGRGGGISVGGGTLALWNTLLCANTAGAHGYGHGLRVDGGTATVSHCTVASHIGDAINRVGGAVAVSNSILWGNADDITGAVFVAYCDIKDGDSNGVNGCISADPLFQYGYYLCPGSLCANTGSMSAATAGLDDRTTRIDGGLDSDVVDLGYHYPAGFDLTYADLYVGPDGDDSLNSGTNVLSPFRTITKALATASDGSRIHIAAGTYTNESETFPLTLSGMTGVQLLGTNRATTILNGANSNQRVLSLSYASGARVEGLTLTGGNTPADYGENQQGLYVVNCSDIKAASCAISANTAYGAQGARTYGGGIYLTRSGVTLDDCDVINNTVRAYTAETYGGGIYLDSGILLISNSVISGNSVGTPTGKLRAGYGGGICIGDGTLTVRNSLLTANTVANTHASSGGYGLRINGGSVALHNCTLSAHVGDAVNKAGGTVALTDCILWGNNDDIVGSVSLAYCDVKDGDNNGTNGCISADPLFQAGYYLDPASPCVNTGSLTAAAGGLSNRTTRLDGQLDEGIVDLGYHYSPAAVVSMIADLYVATNGDDDLNDGISALSPFRTITKALATATDGTRIHVAAGSYTNGAEIFPLTLSWKNGVQLLGTNAGATIINGAGSNQRVLVLSDTAGTRIEGLTITGGNTPADYGENQQGVYAVNCSEVTVASCIITSNTAYGAQGVSTYGGGIYLRGSGMKLLGCEVVSNTVKMYGDPYAYGGGVCLEYGSLLISNTLMRGNSAGMGGAVYGSVGALTMWNVLAYGNTAAASGGYGVRIDSGAASLVNCTLAAHVGDAINQVGGTVALTNCILWGNGDDVAGTVALAYCDVEDGDNNGTNGCISADPLFDGPGTNNFRLLKGSPCINKGLTFPGMASAVDLAGKPRVNRREVDMGAYEAQLAPVGTLIVVR